MLEPSSHVQFATAEHQRLTELDARLHRFFGEMKAETMRGSCGDHYRDFVRGLLLRAQGAGLYDPTQEQA